MFDLKDRTATADMLYALYRAWCDKYNESKVSLVIQTDGSGGIEPWLVGKPKYVSWDSIKEGCKVLMKELMK